MKICHAPYGLIAKQVFLHLYHTGKSQRISRFYLMAMKVWVF